MAGDGQHQPGVAARAADVDVEALVRLLEDQLVPVRAQLVAVEAVRALGLVLDGVEERAAVGRPGRRDHLLDPQGQLPAGLEVLDLQGVLPEAGLVGRVGQQPVVVADHGQAQGHEGLALGQGVDVEHELRGRVRAPGAAQQQRVLPALLGAGRVPEAALPVGRALVRLLDAPEHLAVERLLQAGGGLHDGVGVGVLGLQVGGHGGVRLVAQPEVVVLAGLAVDHFDARAAGGHGRCRGLEGKAAHEAPFLPQRRRPRPGRTGSRLLKDAPGSRPETALRSRRAPYGPPAARGTRGWHSSQSPMAFSTSASEIINVSGSSGDSAKPCLT